MWTNRRIGVVCFAGGGALGLPMLLAGRLGVGVSQHFGAAEVVGVLLGAIFVGLGVWVWRTG